jgi:hypothetical protein
MAPIVVKTSVAELVTAVEAERVTEMAAVAFVLQRAEADVNSVPGQATAAEVSALERKLPVGRLAQELA